MIYFLCIVLPPVAVLLVGKPIQAALNLLLTILGWVPGVIHALFVVSGHRADKRNEKLIKEMRKQKQG